MKWSTNINEFILREYYLITKLETDTVAYRQKLHEAFTRTYPDAEITEQRLADQRRAIIKNNLIPEARRRQIRQQVEELLEDHTNELNQDPREQAHTSTERPNINTETEANISTRTITTIDLTSTQTQEDIGNI